MRIVNLLKNGFYSVASYAAASLLAVLVRKYFVQYLPVELLGLEGVFANLIALLSLAEMGISTVISYNLYHELARKNEREINILMNIYRYVYAMIGGLVFLVGLVLFFCLPFLFQDSGVPWFYVEFVYCIQIGVVLSSYFLAYKRTLFIADQKEYVCIKIDMLCTVMNNGVKLAAVVLWQNYLVYIGAGLFFNLLANGWISWKATKEYPFLHTVAVTFTEMKERKFFVETRNFLIHKISYLVYGSTDILIVSSFLGLRMSGMMANYMVISVGCESLALKFFQGIIPSIGNLVYTEDEDKNYNVYRMLDLGYFLLGGYLACIYIHAFQPFVRLFFGEDFLLPDAYITAVAFNTFLNIQFVNAYNYRSTFGHFVNDRIYMLLSALVNLSSSIVLVQYYGITGTVWGTILGVVFILYGRIQFVYRMIFKKSMKSYLWKHFWWSCLTGLEIWLIFWLLDGIGLEKSYLGLLTKCGLVTLLMGGMQYAVFHRTEEFRDMAGYARYIKNIVCQKYHIGGFGR